MRRIVFGTLLACMALASSPARADDASRLKAAREVVQTSHASDNLRKLFPSLMQQFRPMLLQQAGGNAKLVDGFLQDVQSHFETQERSFIDLVAQIYAREFSEEDLNGLLVFYRSPAGQHLLDKQLVIAQGMAQVGQRWGQMLAKQVLDDFKAHHAPGKS